MRDVDEGDPLVGLGFKVLTVGNWREPDPMLDIFVRLAPSGSGIRRPAADERAAEFLAPTLHGGVPREVRRLFEVARGAMLYGCLFYPLFALGTEQLFRVAEAAVSQKCREVDAPRASTKTFEKKLRYLVDTGAIPLEDADRWDSTRHLRNHASHPGSQTLFGPGNALALLWDATAQINALFGGASSATGTGSGEG